ncbi:ketopantoate reductase PanE/ApbA-domain-containing protein [Mucidula mucida]|nr:ketopantoate reductase PanE/ApbA-domain-containing protein [Mucidula mucida]
MTYIADNGKSPRICPISMQDVLVVGLGAVGAVSAYILKNSGIARVTAVARSNYSIVQDRGIDIKSGRFGDQLRWKPDRLWTSVAEAADTQYTYVVVVTKCLPDVFKTSELLEPLIHAPFKDQPIYVLVQNGLGIETDLYQAVKHAGHQPRIISVAMFVLANQIGPNIIQLGDQEQYVCGVYRPNDFTTSVNSEEELRILKGFGEIIVKGGGSIDIVPEIQRRKFVKNMTNVVLAAICLLTRYTLPSVFRRPPSAEENYTPYYFPGTQPLLEENTIPMMRGMVRELVTLGRALGFPDSEDGVPADSADRLIQFSRDTYSPASSFHKASTLVDCEKDVPMEVEVIWGSVVRLARERQVDMPRVEMAYSLLLVMQNQILRKASELT